MSNIDTLESDFRNKCPQLEGYEDFFNELITRVSREPIGDALGNEIKDLVSGFINETNFDNSRFDSESYVRNYLGRDSGTGWEAILMAWTKGNTTPIHSHPQFASYSFASGRFLIEIFEKTGENEVRLAKSLVVEGNESFYAWTPTGGYDNHIHRLTCLSDHGLSVHVYSADALKGYKYPEPV